MGTLRSERSQPEGGQAPRLRRGIAWLAVLFALFAVAPAAEAQTGTVTGRVIDSSTNQPLASAQVSIPQLSIGVLTQQNGRFILLNVPAGTHTLMCSVSVTEPVAKQ